MPQRVPQLDILRGVAVLLVLGVHSPGKPGESGLLRPLDSFIHRIGWTGVDLFFVLSGFLIGGILFAELRQHGRLLVKRFLVRRALRIWPPYCCLIAFLFVTLALEPGVTLAGAWSRMWPAVVHIQNFIPVTRDHLWSLAVEEHFYFVLPILLWLATRSAQAKRAIPAIPIACAVVCIGSIALRSVLVALGHPGSRAPTYMCVDGLFFGVNLAYLKAYRPAVLAAVVRRGWTLALGFALLVPALIRSVSFQHVVGYTSVYLGYSLLLLHFVATDATSGRLGRVISSRPARVVAFIGLNSYSIYLWHRDFGWLGYQLSQSFGRALGLRGELVWLLNLIAMAVAAIVCGTLMGRLIEQPVIQLRARLFPADAPRAGAPRATQALSLPERDAELVSSPSAAAFAPHSES